jgi:hypothetical protein
MIQLILLPLMTLVVSATLAQKNNLTMAPWCSDVSTYSEFLKKDTVLLHSIETAKTSKSYFEFKEAGSFTFFTDRQSVYDSTNQLMEELIRPIEGTYQQKKNSLTLLFMEPHATTARTYLVTIKSKDELKLIRTPPTQPRSPSTPAPE